MMRKFAIVLVALCGALTGSIATALGLGELTLQSALNQQFRAEIQLHNVGDLSRSQIIANLASQEYFERAGVERIFFLTRIQFEVVHRSPEDVIIRLTTDRNVREPFLNFLVELHWPSGRLLREFTVLLDPPAFSETPPAPIKQAQVELAKQAPALVAAKPAVGEPVHVDQQTDLRVRIKKNDTLWSIARDHRPEKSLSIRQTMLAIQKNNPQAFINNNINLIKAGQLLTIPSATEIRDFSSSQAIVEARRQNDAWQSQDLIDTNSRNEPPEQAVVEDESVTVAAAERAEEAVDEGLLELVSEDAGDEGIPAASAVTELEIAREEGAGTAGPNDAKQQFGLESEPDGSTSAVASSDELDLLRIQLKELQTKISVQDAQLAQLQASLANRKTITEGAKNTANNKDNTEGQPFEGEDLFSSALYIGGLIFLLLAGVVIYGIISRRRSESRIYPSDLQDTLNHAQDDVELDVELDGEFEKELDLTESTLSAESSNSQVVSQEVDVSKYIEEADIYIAYGRYERAVETLKPVIDDNLDNKNLRLKLAEIYIITGDDAGLAEQERALQNLDDTDGLAHLAMLKSESEIKKEKFEHAQEELTEAPELIQPLSEREELADIEFNLEEGAEESQAEGGESAVVDDFSDDFKFELSMEDISSDEAVSQENTMQLSDESAAPDDIDFLVDIDEASTKLELATTYIDMDDKEAATEILNEVLEEGSDEQKKQAQELLSNLS